MGYSVKYIKYIKYSGLGMDSNQFWMILNNFGQFWTILERKHRTKQPTFFENVILI